MISQRPAASRGMTQNDWLESRHSFSFGQYYDPSQTHFGPLLAHNDDVLAPGSGFDLHPHAEIEIVTWVLAGSLEHRDSAGHREVSRPGDVQRLSAGSGVRHSERNVGDDPVRYLQMWLAPETRGAPADYAQADCRARLAAGGLVSVASGVPDEIANGALTLRQPSATLWVGRLAAGESVMLPTAEFVHSYLAVGRGLASAGPDDQPRDEYGLVAGDALRVTGRSGSPIEFTAAEPSEILVWQLASDLG
ncbi:MAG: quercetin 2,3-dioxygenase [Frankiales bacterium]|nr:quercetin 2,3-dioxygenase [Frankiales bacterium]